MKKILKKVILLICMLSLFCLTGCFSSSSDSNDTENDSQTTTPDSDTEDEVVDTRELVSVDELSSIMMEDAFTDNIKIEDFGGLTDPSQVGVNEDEMDDILYPVPADSEFDYIYNANDYNINSSNANNSTAFETLLTNIASVDGLKMIYFPEGIYYFNSTITFYNIKDLYLVGEGVTEWVMNEWTTVYKIENCENFHINNMAIDYAISPSVSGKIISSDSSLKSVTIEIDEAFDMTAYQYNNGKISYGNYMEYVLDPLTNEFIPDANGMLRYNSTGDSITAISDGVYDDSTKTLTLTFASSQTFITPSVGKTVSVSYTMYENYAVKVEDTKDMYVEGLTIYTTAGMAMALYSTENIYYNRYMLVRRDDTHLVTATADGFHTNDCLGDLFITNSIFEASHDDSINICTFYKSVSFVSGSSLTLDSYSFEKNYPMNAGDEIEIYNSSMEVVGSYVVESVDQSGTSFDITVDKRATGVEVGFYVGNLTRNPNVVIDNCIFRNKRNRGILLQAQNAVVTNCSFINILHGPVMLHSSFDVFSEGLIPRNLTVSNCKFLQNNYGGGLDGDISSFRYGGTIVENTIQNITIENNFFAMSAKSAVNLNANGGSTVANNLIYRCFENSSTKKAINITTTCDTVVKDNYAMFESEQADFTFVYISDNCRNITTENNVNREDN